MRVLALLLAGLLAIGGGTASLVAQDSSRLPRFVSIKASKAHVRQGPSRDHDLKWTYVKSGLPIEIVQDFENWHKVRDWEGGEGWMHTSLLSSRRFGLIAPWRKDKLFNVRSDPDPDSALVVRLEPMVIVQLLECNGQVCKISGEGWQGWVEQGLIWGVYSNEVF